MLITRGNYTLYISPYIKSWSTFLTTQWMDISVFNLLLQNKRIEILCSVCVRIVSSRLGICLVSWLQCIVWFHGKYVYILYNSLKDKNCYFVYSSCCEQTFWFEITCWTSLLTFPSRNSGGVFFFSFVFIFLVGDRKWPFMTFKWMQQKLRRTVIRLF